MKPILGMTVALALLIVAAPAQAGCHYCVDQTTDAVDCSLGDDDSADVCVTNYVGWMYDHAEEDVEDAI